MTKKDILDFLKSNQEYFQKKYNIKEIGLFGSYARDEADENSDIDIFVTMKPSLFALVNLKEEIENRLNKKVDIIRNHKKY